MSKKHEIASEFMDNINAEMPDASTTWSSYEGGVEIEVKVDGFEYTFNFDTENISESRKDSRTIEKCHKALADAIEEVENDGC